MIFIVENNRASLIDKDLFGKTIPNTVANVLVSINNLDKKY